MKSTLKKYDEFHDYHGFMFAKHLIQGKKRKIVVLIKARFSYMVSDEEIAYAAAFADERGWKKVILQEDDGMGDTIEGVNPHQFSYNYNFGRSGFFVAAPRELDRDR